MNPSLVVRIGITVAAYTFISLVLRDPAIARLCGSRIGRSDLCLAIPEPDDLIPVKRTHRMPYLIPHDIAAVEPPGIYIEISGPAGSIYSQYLVIDGRERQRTKELQIPGEIHLPVRHHIDAIVFHLAHIIGRHRSR